MLESKDGCDPCLVLNVSHLFIGASGLETMKFIENLVIMKRSTSGSYHEGGALVPTVVVQNYCSIYIC